MGFRRDGWRMDDAVHPFATALGSGTFDPSTLDRAASRHDEVGTLARTFQTMAVEVKEREQSLREQVQRLTVEIDRAKVAEAVSDITDSDYFQRIKEKADELRWKKDNPGKTVGSFGPPSYGAAQILMNAIKIACNAGHGERTPERSESLRARDGPSRRKRRTS